MKKILTIAMLALFAQVSVAQTFGNVGNFDVINNTGKVAHGFEIELDGISPSNITSLFGEPKRWPGMERYGFPVVTTTPTGVKVTYKDLNASTPSGTLPVAPYESCWPHGSVNYGPNYPCDHFGVSTNNSPSAIRYTWLVESTPGSTNLVPVDAGIGNAAIASVVPVAPILVQPPAPPGQPLPPPVLQPQAPIVHAVQVAPPANQLEFGPVQWVKVTATGSMNNIAVEDLMGDNALVQGMQTQVEWQRLQFDSGKPPGGTNGTIDFTGVKLDPGAKAIAYRFEYYEYTGAFDPQTGEAITAPDTSGSKTPPATVGKYLGANMIGANFDGGVPAAPKLPIAPSINATIAGGIVNHAYSSAFDVTPFNAGDVVNVIITGLPAGLSYATVGSTTTISGTPTVVGSFPISITANDTTNNTTISANTFVDIADAPMTFNVTFPDATVGTPYTYPFLVSGGYGLLTFSTVSALPAGLGILNDTLNGTPTATGTFPIDMTVRDSLNFSQNAPRTNLVVKTAPVVVPVIPTPVACSGTNAIMISASATTIQVSGITVDVPANVTFVAPLNAASAFAADNLMTFAGFIDNATKHCVADTTSIAAGLTGGINVTPYHGQVGVEYSPTPAEIAAGGMAIQINAAGGIAPYTIAVSGLPLGMSLDATNTLVGVPTVAGTYTLAISINDNNGQSTNSSATLIVDPAAPVAVACSGTQEVITNTSTAANLNNIAKFDGTILKTPFISTTAILLAIPQNGVVYTFNGGLVNGTFKVGDMVTYSGTYGAAVDANGKPMYCIPTVVTVDPAVVPTPVPTPTPTPVPTPTPTPVGCALGTSKVVAHAKITAVVGNVITISGKQFTVPGCAAITYKGHANSLKTGYDAEVKAGYVANSVTYATKLIVDDGK
jgi:hypothetical protein